VLISYDAAQTQLAELFDPLWEIVDDAWDDWQTETSPKAKAILTTRSRASNMHDYMVWRARRFCETRDDIEVRVKRLMCVLVIHTGTAAFAIRFKKLDEDGLSRNQPTKQVQTFRRQDSLDGIPEAHHLEVGYILSRDQSKINAIEMVCPSGEKSNAWRCEITPLAGEQDGSVVVFTPPNPNGPRNVIVRRKDDAGELFDDGTNSN
jgi:hypothetical protein